MSVNRVQKLLFSEYCDFEDMVLIESPFAQTTRDGRGIRQVHIGLTPSKLVLATDVLPPVDTSKVTYIPGIDPDIETFELIAIYPVECVNLSIYRRKKRQALKARFCNNRVLYFELGGFEKRKMFWNLWCEKVRFLSPEEGSSHSETSVATSTTSSTLYLLDKRLVIKDGLKQLWCRFGPNASLMDNTFNGNDDMGVTRKWTDRNLYMGKDFDDSPLNYKPIINHPEVADFVIPKMICDKGFKTKRSPEKSRSTLLRGRSVRIGDSVQVNRFCSGICDGCGAGLYLTCEDYTLPKTISQILFQKTLKSSVNSTVSFIGFEELAETAVRLWEIKPLKSRWKHRRRYGFMPQSHFLYGLGPWKVIPGGQYAVQVKRAVSLVTLRTQPLDAELRLGISKKQLVASVSCEVLNSKVNKPVNRIRTESTDPVLLFWTTDYWYRPRAAQDVYFKMQDHLNSIKKMQDSLRIKEKQSNNRLSKRQRKRIKFDSDDDEEIDPIPKSKSRKPPIKFVFSTTKSANSSECLRRNKKTGTGAPKQLPQKLNFVIIIPALCCWLPFSDAEETCSEPKFTSLQEIKEDETLELMKQILEVKIGYSAWDFDSTTMAQQLTMIDKELFLKITSVEFEAILFHQNIKSYPNVTAFVAFSHRISCLVATEILRDKSIKLRARLLARFINVANKCHGLSNFQTCKAVLCGLQSPSIYRLRFTWAYVRKKHASKYQIYEFLCRLYKDPRFPTYQKTFFIVSQAPPYLPYAGDIFSKLLDRIPKYKFHNNESKEQNDDKLSQKSDDSLFSKFLKMLNGTGDDFEQFPNTKRRTKFVSLGDYFKPLDRFEDNRLSCLDHTVFFVEKCQLAALKYSYKINEMTRSYLLKARYNEDNENFKISISIEGPTNLNSNNYNKKVNRLF